MFHRPPQPEQPLDATATSTAARLMERHPAPVYGFRAGPDGLELAWGNAIARCLGEPRTAFVTLEVPEALQGQVIAALRQPRPHCFSDASHPRLRVELAREIAGDPEGWLLLIHDERGVAPGLGLGTGESAALLIAALDVMPAEVAVLDQTGQIIVVNRAWRDFAKRNGLEQDDAGIGSNYLEACDQAHGDAAIEAQAVATGLRSVLSGRQSATYVEYPCDSPEEQRWFQVRASGFEWGGARYAVVAHESLTEAKRAEQQHRQQLDEMAHQWQKNSLGELASGIAHELNQPLGSITNYMNGCLRRLEAGTIDREQLIKTVRGCAELAEFAGGIIKRMRGFATHATCQYQPVSLNDAVCQAMRFFKASPDSSRVRLRVELAEDLPEVRADEVQIQQVALNLLRNARDAVIAGKSSTAMVRVSTYLDDQAMVCLSVTDNGQGLPGGVEARLFEPFFSTKSQGMGLGLSISKTIAEVHGGRLTARNAPGGGAVFELKLPALQRTGGLRHEHAADGRDPIALQSTQSRNQGGVA